MSTDTRPAVNHVVETLVSRMTVAWQKSDGTLFASSFTPEGRFVAFDGTTLTGPQAIAEYHQRAFSGPLRNTHLRISLEEIREISADIVVFFTKGGIHHADNQGDGVIGESVQTYVVVKKVDLFLIDVFQNTRFRPITDEQSLSCWKDFDAEWSKRQPK